MKCGCCGESYEDENDRAVFGTLIDAGGKAWNICGPCIQAMWHERAPGTGAEPAPV